MWKIISLGQQASRSGDVIEFEMMCGDFNFDNLSACKFPLLAKSGTSSSREPFSSLWFS
jgi:hypothetical protein